MILNRSIIFVIIAIILISCNSDTGDRQTQSGDAHADSNVKAAHKPPASANDTMIIDYQAAVFYHPDSLQIMKIKAQTDSMDFDGSMHEFFYQMRNARMVIKKEWPKLKIVEAKNYRYLLFITGDNLKELIDLNTKNDPYGLFVFNTQKSPLFIDMMNIETEVSFYLK